MILLSAQLVRPGVHVGPAFPDDVEAIDRLLRLANDDCVPVGVAELRRRLGEFETARSPSGCVVGCAAVRSEERVELRSVAVDPLWRGAGVGRLLVERAVARAHAAGESLFCVSRKPEFFEALGFTRLPHAAVPERPGAQRSGPRRWALIHPLHRTEIAA